MSPIFHLRIHQKILTSTKFLIKYFTIFHFFLHSLVQVGHRITGFLLLSSMLLERVVTWQLFFTRRTNCRLLRTWLSMLLRNMITNLLFALCIKMTVWSLVFFCFSHLFRCQVACWRTTIVLESSHLTISFRFRAGIT